MLDIKIPGLSKRRWVLLAVMTVTLLIQATPGWAGAAPSEPASTEAPYQISLFNTIAAGGIIGLVIIFVSLAAVALIVENFLTIRRDRIVPASLIDELQGHIQGKQYGQAQHVCRGDGSFLAQVVGAGLGQMGAMFGFFDMQNAMQEVSERELSKLHQKLEYLSFIASTSPMLGLLGTVTGMISAFNEIARTEGSARPSQLAGGISEALVTTCLGLVVAIPVLFFIAFFRRRIDGFVSESEVVVERLMGHFRTGLRK
jgi:biopolymer transport protein ExbB